MHVPFAVALILSSYNQKAVEYDGTFALWNIKQKCMMARQEAVEERGVHIQDHACLSSAHRFKHPLPQILPKAQSNNSAEWLRSPWKLSLNGILPKNKTTQHNTKTAQS